LGFMRRPCVPPLLTSTPPPMRSMLQQQQDRGGSTGSTCEEDANVHQEFARLLHGDACSCGCVRSSAMSAALQHRKQQAQHI
jgi:hypothetical protein